MIAKKKKPALTREEALELIENAMRKPGIGTKTLLKLQGARSKLVGEQPTPAPATSQVLWKPEDLFSEDREKWVREEFEHWATHYEGRYPMSIEEVEKSVPSLEDIKAANEFIKSDGFWTLGPDGNRWGPVMRTQGRYIGPVNGDPVGEWLELTGALGHAARTVKRS